MTEDRKYLKQRGDKFRAINSKIEKLAKKKHKVTVDWNVDDRELEDLDQLIDTWMMVQGVIEPDKPSHFDCQCGAKHKVK